MAITGYNSSGWPEYDNQRQATTGQSYWKNYNDTRGDRVGGAQYNPEMEMPADWQQYLASGGDPMKKSVYENWRGQNQRYNELGGFVDKMSDPGSVELTNRFNGANVDAGNMLSQYLTTSPGDMPNRFEGALTDSQNRVTSLLDNPDSIKQSAAYKFRLGQGLEGVNRSMGARGLLGSGNRLAALNDYAQGQASQEYGDQFNRLSGLLGMNTNAWLGDKNANTSQWGQKGNALANYYGATSQNVNANQGQRNSERLGWAAVGANSNLRPQPQSWGIANSW